MRVSWEENLAGARSACRNAAGVPAQALPAPRPDRNGFLFGEAQALGSGARSLAPDADTPSPAAWTEFQPVSLEALLPFSKDVNRAKLYQDARIELEKEDHYLSVMVQQAFGSGLKSWLLQIQLLPKGPQRAISIRGSALGAMRTVP